MTHDTHHMERCLELAQKGYGWVHPNPLVGAVLVKRGRVIAEGFHRRFGGPHAERECLDRAGHQARGATMYVNLEPCIHHGKTPPCVDAIIGSGVREVVIAMRDPNSVVNGRGISALRRAGIRVRTGVMRNQARILNDRFVWWHLQGVPYVGLKWAQTLEGYIADSRGRSKWITGEDARRYAHVLRSGYDAVLVGAGTVLADDPRLTVRHVAGRDPVRIVLDARLRVTGDEKIFRHRNGRTLVVTSSAKVRAAGRRVRTLLSRGVEVIGMDGGGAFPPAGILRVLAAEGIASILVEGGPDTIQRFFEAGVFNAYHVFVRASLLGGGKRALAMPRPTSLTSLAKTEGRDVMLFRNGDMLVEGGPSR